MTTIVTTVNNKSAIMLGDSGITGYLKHPDMNKIVRQGTWLIGVCGDNRICDLLQYQVSYPKPPVSLIKKPVDEWYKWVVKTVVPKIIDAVDHNLHKSYRGTIGDSEALIITHGRAFYIDEGLGIGKAEPYWAVGSGSHLALGSLATQSENTEWEEHYTYARQAIEMAQVYDPYTRGNISGYISHRSGKIEEYIK